MPANAGKQTKSKVGSDGGRKLASGAGRGAKSGGEAKKPPTGKPARKQVRGETQSGTPTRAKDDTSRSRRRGSSKEA